MSKNPLKLDPTQTAIIRLGFTRDISRRFNAIRQAVIMRVGELDFYATQEPVVNAPKSKPFVFRTRDDKLKDFITWLQQQINKNLLEPQDQFGNPVTAKPWYSKYLVDSYRKGIVKAYAAVRKKDLRKPAAFYDGSKEEFLRSTFAAGERTSTIKMIYTRSYQDLKGITQQMSSKMSRVMAEGLSRGDHSRVIGRNLAKIVTGISKDRAQMIARTEVVAAHAEGQLDAFDELDVGQVGAEVEFSTLEDDAVCPECEDLEGQIFDIDDARGMIPVHPNCRCSWLPVLKLPKSLKSLMKSIKN